ncbi:MAG: archaeosortase/exosortase family protein [Chitinophagaceae bacterium]|nr:archaeosortase/exosortase family protein [Chitinophagaceae bacterium]MCW5904052.1 archaeosortase/exosortase family protein [Chitinophagaceae bacterium]
MQLLGLNIKKQIDQIPKSVQRFAIKALILFIVWQVMYIFILMPNRLIDKPLSLFTGKSTVAVLKFVGFANETYIAKEVPFRLYRDNQLNIYDKTTIFGNGKRLVGISDSCNGLSLFILYIGFLICFPSKIKLKVLFFFLGIITIFVVNIIRTSMLCIIHEKYPNFLDFAHHYLFNIVVYSTIFLLWVIFSKKSSSIKTNEYSNEQ